MELVALFASLVVVIFLGWNALCLVSRKAMGMPLPAILSLSYMLGIGFISLEMLSFYFFKLPYRPVFILMPWGIAILANAVFYYFKRIRDVHIREDYVKPSSKKGPLETFLEIGIVFEVIYAIFRALIKPIESYDAIAIYAIKSKMFYTAGAITTDILNTMKALFPHPDYPLNIPLIETFFYLCMRSLNDQFVKIIFPLFFIATLIIMYYAIRRFASRTYALLCVFVLASVPQFNAYAANAYHELPLACYYFASALLLFRWFENPDEAWCLPISAILVGLAGWTKNEGLLYCVVNMAVLGIFTAFNSRKINAKNIFYVAVYPVIIVAILFPWLWIKRAHGITNSEINLLNVNPQYLVAQLPKLGPIFYEFQKQFFGPKKWNIIWPAAAFIIAVNYRKAFTGVQKYIALSLFLAIAGYILFYLISYVDAVYFLGKTWSRFLLHFLPVVVYWLALILKDDIKI